MTVLALLCALIGASHAATTVEMLAGNANFSTLVDLVTKAGLVPALNGGTFTIFAPTNDAFNKVPQDTMTALGNDVNALTNVLKYHVVQGSVMSSAAMNELQVATLNGQKARFNIYKHNNAVTIQGAKITDFDMMASNGVIHVLSNVMMPPMGDIVAMVSSSKNFSMLLNFVSQAGLASALKGDNLTLFAPSNAAFGKVPANVVSQITQNVTLLTDILAYHVVPHTEYSAGLYNREHLKTIDAHHDMIAIHATQAGVRVNNNGNVVKADIGVTNGVVHEIDHVLIPRRHRQAIVGK